MPATKKGKLIASLCILSAICLPSAFVAWQARDMPQLGHLQDDGIYWVLGKALAGGHGYKILSLPAQPWQTKYPPAYPWLLSFIWRVHPQFPQNLPLASLFSWAMLPLLVVAARRFYTELGFGTTYAWVLCALLALNVRVAFFSLQLMPELLFCSILLASFLLADSPGSGWKAGLAGLAAGVGYLVKSATLPLLLSSPLLFLWRKQRRQALLFAAGMLPCLLGWHLWTRSHFAPPVDDVGAYYTDYVGYRLYNVGWRDLPLLVWKNLDALLLGIGELLAFGESGSAWGRFLPRALALVACFGAIRLAVRRKLSHFHTFALLQLPLLLAWHFPPGPRFTLPLLPLLLAGLASEVENAVRILRKLLAGPSLPKMILAASGCAALMWLAFMAAISTYGGALPLLLRDVSASRQRLAAKHEAYAWIPENTPPGSRFIAFEDAQLYLYALREASSYPTPPKLMYHDDLKGLEDRYRALPLFAERNQISYLLLTPSDFNLEFYPDQARSALMSSLANRSVFEPVHSSAGVDIYRIHAGTPSLHASN